MNVDKKRAIDRELRRERYRGLRKWLLLAAALLAVLLAYTPVFSTEVAGETISVADQDRTDLSKTSLKIRLDDGKVVSLMADTDLVHASGKRASVSKMTSLFGMSSYQFIGYAE